MQRVHPSRPSRLIHKKRHFGGFQCAVCNLHGLDCDIQDKYKCTAAIERVSEKKIGKKRVAYHIALTVRWEVHGVPDRLVYLAQNASYHVSHQFVEPMCLSEFHGMPVSSELEC